MADFKPSYQPLKDKDSIGKGSYEHQLALEATRNNTEIEDIIEEVVDLDKFDESDNEAIVRRITNRFSGTEFREEQNNLKTEALKKQLSVACQNVLEKYRLERDTKDFDQNRLLRTKELKKVLAKEIKNIFNSTSLPNPGALADAKNIYKYTSNPNLSKSKSQIDLTMLKLDERLQLAKETLNDTNVPSTKSKGISSKSMTNIFSAAEKSPSRHSSVNNLTSNLPMVSSKQKINVTAKKSISSRDLLDDRDSGSKKCIYKLESGTRSVSNTNLNDKGSSIQAISSREKMILNKSKNL